MNMVWNCFMFKIQLNIWGRKKLEASRKAWVVKIKTRTNTRVDCDTFTHPYINVHTHVHNPKLDPPERKKREKHITKQIYFYVLRSSVEECECFLLYEYVSWETFSRKEKNKNIFEEKWKCKRVFIGGKYCAMLCEMYFQCLRYVHEKKHFFELAT